jgi:hypothetical protein
MSLFGFELLSFQQGVIGGTEFSSPQVSEETSRDWREIYYCCCWFLYHYMRARTHTQIVTLTLSTIGAETRGREREAEMGWN